MSRILTLYVLSIAIIGIAFTGCQQTCSNIPNQSPASIRIVDAVANADTLNVFIDGKLFGIAYYDLQAYSSTGNNSFGYHQTYSAGGLAVTAGTHHVAAVVAGTNDTIVSTDVALIDHQQTLAFIGRYHGTAAQHPQLKYLDDETRAEDHVQNYIRFLDAVPDANGVDIYFSNNIEISGGKPKPDLTLSYTEISNNSGDGSGTGRSPNDYLSIPLGTGITITAKGDTSAKLFSFPQLSNLHGFLATLVVRGENQPIDHERSVDNLVIFDGNSTGNALDFPTFSIRLANATRLSPLSLLISSSTDQDSTIPRSTANTPYPSQEKVLNIPSGFIGEYMSNSPTKGFFHFWLSRDSLPADTLYHFNFPSLFNANERYTFVAIDTMPLGFSGPDYSEFTLFDTTGIPSDPGFGRIRFVNASPDHVMHFTFAGKTYSMKQRDVAFADMAVGSYTITVSDGAKSGTITFNVLSKQPITVFFMPATSTNDFPYTVVER